MDFDQLEHSLVSTVIDFLNYFALCDVWLYVSSVCFKSDQWWAKKWSKNQKRVRSPIWPTFTSQSGGLGLELGKDEVNCIIRPFFPSWFVGWLFFIQYIHLHLSETRLTWKRENITYRYSLANNFTFCSWMVPLYHMYHMNEVNHRRRA